MGTAVPVPIPLRDMDADEEYEMLLDSTQDREEAVEEEETLVVLVAEKELTSV
jgi:hypothetical protein